MGYCATMVKINRIYTRSGDDGSTGLVGGERIAKDSLRVEAYGTVDELNAHVGNVRTLAESQHATSIVELLAIIQNQLFDLGCELATPAGKTFEGMQCISMLDVSRLERWIDEAMEGIPELRSFALPGGSPLNAALHIARTVCRRAERRVITLRAQESVSDTAIVYLNRLSDLLFALSRKALAMEKKQEFLWEPGKNLIDQS